MLKVAMVGAWHVHFGQYAKEISDHKDCKITALWDSDFTRGQQAAADWHCDFEPNYDKLLSRDDVDAIAVVSETSLHPKLIQKAAEAGKHIFTEKVLCFTLAEAEAICQSIMENGVKFCISFPWRCYAEYQTVKKVIEDGTLGEITYARVRNAHDGASSQWLPEYFYDPQLCGGGAMMDLGAHPMYLLLDLFGMPDAVTSVFTRCCGKAVEDNAVSILEYNGRIASSETGFVSKNCPFMLELTGTQGTLIWNGFDNKVKVSGPNGLEEPILCTPLKNPIDQWVDGILYGEPIHFGINDAVSLTKIMEKAYESARLQKRIVIL